MNPSNQLNLAHPLSRLAWKMVPNNSERSFLLGTSAVGRKGDRWPCVDVNGKERMLHLLATFDTDDLPEDMQDAYGGPGHLFQLFVAPVDWAYDAEYPFDVWVIPKSEATARLTPPEKYVLQDAIGIGFSAHVDFPFNHGGPYLPGHEQFFDKHDDETLHHWDDKIGGWPSLEQGPSENFEQHETILLQVVGGGITGDDYAFDGHAWLVKNDQDEYVWDSTMG